MDISQLIAENGGFFYLIAFLWTFLEGETFVLFAAFAAAISSNLTARICCRMSPTERPRNFIPIRKRDSLSHFRLSCSAFYRCTCPLHTFLQRPCHP